MADEPTKPTELEERRPVQMQRVFIKFSNGKVAVFSGPAIFSSAEMKLVKIQIADIVFSEPFEVMMKVPTKPPTQENQSVDTPESQSK